MLTADDLPARLSASSDWPGLTDYMRLRQAGYELDVYLDGAKVERCVAADRGRGWVAYIGEVGEERVRLTREASGRVEFALRRRAPAESEASDHG